VIGYYSLCHPTPKGKGKKKAPVAPAEFAQQLMIAHPHEATRAFAPLVSLFDEVLDEAVAAGAVRRDLSRRWIAGVVLEAIMFNAFSTTIGGSRREAVGGDPADELWELLMHGIEAGK
jgi:predicted acyl esterase